VARTMESWRIRRIAVPFGAVRRVDGASKLEVFGRRALQCKPDAEHVLICT